MPKQMQQYTSQCVSVSDIHSYTEKKKEKEKSVSCITLRSKVCAYLCAIGLMPDFDSLWHLLSCSLIFSLASDCQTSFNDHFFLFSFTIYCTYELKPPPHTNRLCFGSEIHVTQFCNMDFESWFRVCDWSSFIHSFESLMTFLRRGRKALALSSQAKNWQTTKPCQTSEEIFSTKSFQWKVETIMHTHGIGWISCIVQQYLVSN